MSLEVTDKAKEKLLEVMAENVGKAVRLFIQGIG
jgi:Fe-S cluster assembly iron-binding protein IscA